jgi:hypothetical protein
MYSALGLPSPVTVSPVVSPVTRDSGTRAPAHLRCPARGRCHLPDLGRTPGRKIAAPSGHPCPVTGCARVSGADPRRLVRPGTELGPVTVARGLLSEPVAAPAVIAVVEQHSQPRPRRWRGGHIEVAFGLAASEQASQQCDAGGERGDWDQWMHRQTVRNGIGSRVELLHDECNGRRCGSRRSAERGGVRRASPDSRALVRARDHVADGSLTEARAVSDDVRPNRAPTTPA